jgi:hypothetical protein
MWIRLRDFVENFNAIPVWKSDIKKYHIIERGGTLLKGSRSRFHGFHLKSFLAKVIGQGQKNVRVIIHEQNSRLRGHEGQDSFSLWATWNLE